VLLGLPDGRVLRVLGLASSSLFDDRDPYNPVNRRISIIVMNQEAEDRLSRTAETSTDSESARNDEKQPSTPAAPTR
jgi:chemotaxis protein MotB